MKVENVSAQQAALFVGATHRFNITYEDLSATAGTSLTQVLAAVAARRGMRFCGFNLVTAFDGTSTTNLTLALGVDRASGTDDADAFLAATELHNDATEIVIGPVPIADVDASSMDTTFGQAELDVLTSCRTTANALLKLQPRAYSDAAEIEAVWTSTGADLTDLTSGEIDLYFAIADLSKR